MLEDILNGTLPTTIFRNLMQQNPAIGNIQIGEMLADEFVDLDSFAKQLLWHWKGPGKTQGIDDDGLNAELIKLFKEAGYFEMDS